jgi:hypothetical protein
LVLAPDRQIEATLLELITGRAVALGIDSVSVEIFVHPERDAGCFFKSIDFLRSIRRDHTHALVVFDREGCGSPMDAREIERDLEQRLTRSGWPNSAAICIDPELEVWVWADSPHVERVVGWTDASQSLRDWLTAEALWSPDSPKPSSPKAALEKALRRSSKARSSALFAQLAMSVTLASCTDRAFLRFKGVIQAWFPAGNEVS